MNFFKSKISQSDESLISLQEQFDSLNELFDSKINELKDMTEKYSTMESEFNRVSEENKELQLKIEELNTENAEVTQELVSVDELASIKAVEVLAECGHAQVDIIDSEAQSDQTILDIFKSLKGKELADFYQANRHEIIKHLNTQKS